jgi:hypothetical protein
MAQTSVAAREIRETRNLIGTPGKVTEDKVEERSWFSLIKQRRVLHLHLAPPLTFFSLKMEPATSMSRNADTQNMPSDIESIKDGKLEKRTPSATSGFGCQLIAKDSRAHNDAAYASDGGNHHSLSLCSRSSRSVGC